MNYQPIYKKNKGNPIRFVWLITLLSFSVGVFMVYLVWSTLTDLRNDRERLLELKANTNSIQANLSSNLAKQKSEISALLEGTINDSNTKQDFQLLFLVKKYRKIVSNPDLVPVFDQLERNIHSLFAGTEKLSWWASAYNRTVSKIPEKQEEIASILHQIFETVDKAEGQLHLERAAKIRQIRSHATKKTIEITIDDINEITASNDFSLIRRDITDMMQLSERLHIETEPDSFMDIKDNKIRTLLARVRLNTKLSGNEKFAEKTKINLLLDHYETLLFGQGYRIDNDQQTIVLGYDGEFDLILDRLKMINERKILREDINRTYEKTQNSLGMISSETDFIAQQEARKVEKILGQTWRTMIIIWLVTSMIYAMLSFEIIMTVKQQIKAIEDSNTDLEAMAAELKKSESRLHRLSSDLFSVQENERKRVSLELHDELGQSMAALKMQVGSIARRLGSVSTEELGAVCRDMRDNINQIIENVRRLAKDLSPVVLDDLGLQAAIEYLVNNFLKIYNVKINYKYTEINHLFNEDSQRIIYRILQEALNNIGKHAEAKNVSLIIEKINGAVQFTVRDNGKGFNVRKTLDKKDTDRGMGLEAMSERVRILGGKINIVSRPGIDTTITFTAPIR
ncbi:sensor histidine kinase [Thermodesulfobacteriota bacterium]